MAQVAVALSVLSVAFGFFTICVAIISYFVVGKHVFKRAKLAGIANVEHYSMFTVAYPKWPRRIPQRTAKAIELSSIIYNQIQIILFIFSLPTSIWSHANSSFMKYLVLFFRGLCLDFPINVLIPLYVIILAIQAALMGITVLYHYSHTYTTNHWKLLNSVMGTLTSKDSCGPEIKNFIYWTLFMTTARYTVRLLSCTQYADNDGSWVSAGFFGDFSCWSVASHLPLLTLFIVITILYTIGSVYWSTLRARQTPVYPTSPRYHVAVIVCELLLVLCLVSWYDYPYRTALMSIGTSIVLGIYSFKTLPYMPVDPKMAMYINSGVVSSYVAAFYISTISFFMMRGLLPIKHILLLATIPVFVLAYLGMLKYLAKYKRDYFKQTTKNHLRELLRFIAYEEGVHLCCAKLAKLAGRRGVEARIIEAMEDLTPAERTSLFSWTVEKMPMMIWWNKWKFMHADPEARLDMVKYKIALKSTGRVARLTDIAAYTVLRCNIDWKRSGVLSTVMQSHINELLKFDMAAFELMRMGSGGQHYKAILSVPMPEIEAPKDQDISEDALDIHGPISSDESV